MEQENMFMNVTEVAKVMGISESYAYKIIQRMNTELADKGKGYIIIHGKVDRRFFYDHFYATRERR